MPDTMLDRVARALFSNRDPSWAPDGADRWAQAGTEVRERYLRMAAAAVEALAEPTPELLAALNRRWTELQDDQGRGGIPDLLWELAVAEILEEGWAASGMAARRPRRRTRRTPAA